MEYVEEYEVIEEIEDIVTAGAKGSAFCCNG